MQTLRPGRQHHLLRLELSKHGAPSGCMFSVLKASEKQVEPHRKKKRPVFDLYATAVTSFVESYITANQICPKISEVMQFTGGSRSTIRRILNELSIGKNAARSEEVCAKAQDSMTEMHTNHPPSKCMPSNMINVKDSALCCSDKFEQPAAEVDSAQAEVSVDSTNAEMDIKRIGTSAPNLEKKGFSVLRDPALLTLLDQAIHSSNKADANRRVAPLMEVLQQKSSGSSRRVHLSDCGGTDNDLSWEKTLQSIMPASVGGKEDRSALKDEQPRVNRENMIHRFKDEQPKVNRQNMRHSSLSSEECKESPGTVSDSNFAIMVTSSKGKSVLSYIPGLQFVDALKQQAEVFKDLKNVKLFGRTVNTNAYAILNFKNYESMKKALKLKNVIIEGEFLCLQKHKAATVDLTRGDASRPVAFGESSVFQEVMQGMAGSLKKEDTSSKILHSPSYPCVEDKQSNVCMRGQHGPYPSYLQTISIQQCPNNVPLESIASFFSVFGKIQTSYRAFNHGKSSGIQIIVEFENESDKEKAMKVQQFIVDGCSFQLRPASSSLVLHLKREASDASKFQKPLAKACKQHGVIENFCLRSPYSIEVTYCVNERHKIDELLKSLCEDTYVKEGKWDVSPVYEGYMKADFVAGCYKENLKNITPECYKENVKNIVIVLNELSNHLTSLLSKDS